MRAVVFDCDGVLVDSEPVALGLWRDLLDEYRTPYDPAEVAALVGISDPDAHGRFAGRPGMPSRDVFLAEFARRRAEGFRRHLMAFPDAAEAVPELAAAGIPMAVASNAPREALDLALEVSRLGRYFPVAVSSEEVERPKPAPDVYLDAATRLGVDPADCLAVEDSVAGAAAAAAAGMRVVTVARSGLPIDGHAFVMNIDASTILTWLGRG